MVLSRLRFNESYFSSQVGNAAVQMCKNLGCRIIGTAGSPEGFDILKNKLGVDAVFNHRSENYVTEIKESNENIDVIVEMLANVNLQNDLELVAKSGGRILVSIFLFHFL